MLKFEGTIDARGYTPTLRRLHWMSGTAYLGETILDPSVPRDGLLNLDRWRAGRRDLIGPVAECWLGVEHMGGEGPKVLDKLFEIFNVGRLPTYEERQEFCFCNVPEKWYDGMSIPQARKILGDPTWAADRYTEDGDAQHDPIWIKDWRDPRVSPERRHGDTWIATDGRWYGLDDRSRGREIIKQPLGTGESGGGETVPKPEQTLSVAGRLELIERQLAELLAMLRKGNP